MAYKGRDRRMLQAKVAKKPDATDIQLSGTLDENANLSTVIGQHTGRVRFFCREIKRINSVGTKMWIEFFQNLKFRGVDLEFHECSASIVEQMNMLSSFLAGGRVMSICVPYACSSCDTTFDQIYPVATLKQKNVKFNDQPCPSCKAPASFDDYPDQYLAFLKT